MLILGSNLMGGTHNVSLSLGSFLYKDPLMMRSESGYQTGGYAHPTVLLKWGESLSRTQTYYSVNLGYSFTQTNIEPSPHLVLDARLLSMGLSFGKEIPLEYSMLNVGVGLAYSKFSYRTAFFSIQRRVEKSVISPSIEAAIITKVSENISLSFENGFHYFGEQSQPVSFVLDPMHEMNLTRGSVSYRFAIGLLYGFGE